MLLKRRTTTTMNSTIKLQRMNTAESHVTNHVHLKMPEGITQCKIAYNGKNHNISRATYKFQAENFSKNTFCS